MKRSEINQRIEDAKQFFDQHQFLLPPWAYWGPAQWKGRGEDCAEIIDNMLGWDITDFGSGNYERTGLMLFTLRNGNLEKDRKPYAEKVMIVAEEQETPYHFHWNKMEDIINRGGGNLVIEFRASDENEEFSSRPLEVKVDGIVRRIKSGESLVLTPGESVCLEPYVYHRFFGEPGKGRVLVGEVSQVNDDRTDNRFHKPAGRFPDVDEDIEPNHLLVGDYPRYL